MKKFNFQHPQIRYFKDINLEKYTTIKLGKRGDLVECLSLEALQELMEYLKSIKLDFRIVGWGANQVLHNTLDCLFIKLEFDFDKKYLQEFREEYELPASVGMNQLTAAAIKHGLSGWEVFTGIPASLGGAICMNAGTSLGEVCEIVQSVKILKADGKIETIYPETKDFSYRKSNFLEPGDIVVGATLVHRGKDKSIPQKIKDYLQYRKNTQPLGTKNCGSVFKNLSQYRAGQTIDSLGLKKFGSVNIAVSSKHGNFIENLNGAKSEEFIELVDCLQTEIERCTGLKFELEVKIY